MSHAEPPGDAAPRPARGAASPVSSLLRRDSKGNLAEARGRLVLTVDDRDAVLVELRLDGGRDASAALAQFTQLFDTAFSDPTRRPPPPNPVANHYVRCMLDAEEIDTLVEADNQASSGSAGTTPRTIYHVWPDFIIQAHLDRSVTTVKADAATRTYACTGAGVVWAVIDSGIDQAHPHFAGGALTDASVAGLHHDFTPLLLSASAGAGPAPSSPLTDAFGHGTHVAGIIAGAAPAAGSPTLRIAANNPTAQGLPCWERRALDVGGVLAGVAPQARLVSLKVLSDSGQTLSSAVIEAIDFVRRTNADGRSLRIHGVNLSLGCDWMPTEFAAGQSPLCHELDLLVGTGVVAVVSAGNSGAGGTTTGVSSDVYGRLSTISDPGNSASAITVGSTHRYRPHTYGVTFDSSKGPTLDGRSKPDLVAPGERITSAATGQMRLGVGPLTQGPADPPDLACYVEDSGTSMAAAHVSGVVAAFLSARTEFIGRPEDVKQLFVATATSLGRHEFFQGAGLIDLMRAMSSV